jgi:hypothetical protein
MDTAVAVVCLSFYPMTIQRDIREDDLLVARKY